MATIDDFVQKIRTVFRDYDNAGLPIPGTEWDPPKADIRDALAVTLAGILQDLVNLGVQADAVLKGSWTDLAATPGTRDGQTGEVNGDSGTHTDPVAGGTVPNSGRFSWSVSSAGWKWVSADTLSSKLNVSVFDALNAKTGFLDGLTDPDTGEFVYRDSEGRVGFRYHPLIGFSVPGGTFSIDDSGSLRVVTSEGVVLMDATPLPAADPVPAYIARKVIGAETDTSVKMVLGIEGDGPGICQAILTKDARGEIIVARSPAEMPVRTEKNDREAWREATLVVDGLSSWQEYFVWVVVDGRKPATPTFHFQTAPAEGQSVAYAFDAYSCNDTLPETFAPGFEAMATENSQWRLSLGDFGYPNPRVIDLRKIEWSGTRRQLVNPSIAKTLYKPFVGLIDDHEMGNNVHVDTVLVDGTGAQSMASVRRMLRKLLPMYPSPQIAAGETDIDKVILTQVKKYGLDRHLFVDTRSQQKTSSPSACIGDGVNPVGSWDQMSWLFGQLDAAQADGIINLFLHFPSSWIGGSGTESFQNRWPAEQTQIANYIRDNITTTRVIITGGDLHRFAADNTYDPSTGGGFACFSFLSSGIYQVSGSGNGTWIWQGSNGLLPGRHDAYLHIERDLAGEVTALFRDGAVSGDLAAKTFGTFSTLAATPTVAFAASASSGAGGSTMAISVVTSGPGRVGGGVVHWESDNGQSGDLHLSPNRRKHAFNAVVPASGSTVITLSSPVRCTLGGQITHTLSKV